MASGTAAGRADAEAAPMEGKKGLFNCPAANCQALRCSPGGCEPRDMRPHTYNVAIPVNTSRTDLIPALRLHFSHRRAHDSSPLSLRACLCYRHTARNAGLCMLITI